PRRADPAHAAGPARVEVGAGSGGRGQDQRVAERQAGGGERRGHGDGRERPHAPAPERHCGSPHRCSVTFVVTVREFPAVSFATVVSVNESFRTLLNAFFAAAVRRTLTWAGLRAVSCTVAEPTWTVAAFARIPRPLATLRVMTRREVSAQS